MSDLGTFVRESNKIEGILRDPLPRELTAHESILNCSALGVFDITSFVGAIQPDAVLRDKRHLNVRVGNHIAPQGGEAIVYALANLLKAASDGDPYVTHCQYETLHPFTDGNGRSGRALWLWMMVRRGQRDRALALGFLHNWYYQTLEHSHP